MGKILKNLFIFIIRVYQVAISPMLGAHCRHTPSCSQYMIVAIQEWGLTKGVWLGLKRFSRCHPWGTSGYDPVLKKATMKKKNMHQDEDYMRRALELARLGQGKVSPNPMVGCVITKEGAIIGEGWHQQYGEAHAEKNAIDSVSDKISLKGSTVYVNLEPCSHYGKTPPCSDLLIMNQVSRVVISTQDPNPLVDGGGIKKLQDAGIEVVVGVLKKEGEALNEDFFLHMTRKKIEAVD